MKLKKYFTHIRLCSNLEHTRSGKSKNYSINCKYCNINKKEMCNAAEQRTEEQLTIVSSKKSSIFEAKQW